MVRPRMCGRKKGEAVANEYNAVPVIYGPPAGIPINSSQKILVHADDIDLNRPDGRVGMADEDVEIVQSFSYLGVNKKSFNDMSEVLQNHGMCGRILRSKHLGRYIKVYQKILRPIVLGGSETWTLTQADAQTLSVWDRKVLRTIYGPVRDGI